jgi:hypothetical protein
MKMSFCTFPRLNNAKTIIIMDVLRVWVDSHQEGETGDKAGKLLGRGT